MFVFSQILFLDLVRMVSSLKVEVSGNEGLAVQNVLLYQSVSCYFVLDFNLVCRPDIIQWGILGASYTAVGKTRERLSAQVREVWSQQNPWYLWLHQIWPPAQPKHFELWASTGAVYVFKGFSRHHYPTGKVCLGPQPMLGKSLRSLFPKWWIVAQWVTTSHQHSESQLAWAQIWSQACCTFSACMVPIYGANCFAMI